MFGFLKNLLGKSQEKALIKSKVNEVLDELEKQSQREVIYIKTRIANNLNLLQSKVGGVPYIPVNSQVLEQAEQDDLYLLAQINLSELPPNTILKEKSGILQFWIDKGTFGTEKSKVIFYEEVKEHLSEEEILQKYTPKIEDIKVDSLALSFKLGYEMINRTNIKFDKWFDQIWKQKFGELYSEKEKQYIFDYQYKWFEELYKNKEEYFDEHKIGGYPYYVQNDIALDDKGIVDIASEEQDIVLLQIGEDMKGDEWVICIGDCGVANFHISKQELEKLDFSKVFYNVDCY